MIYENVIFIQRQKASPSLFFPQTSRPDPDNNFHQGVALFRHAPSGIKRADRFKAYHALSCFILFILFFLYDDKTTAAPH